MNMRIGWVVAMFALLATGCGVELTAGGQTGDVRAVATSNGSSSRAPGPSRAEATAREAGSADAATSGAAGSLVVRGSLAFTAAVTLVREDGEEVPITRGYSDAVVRIEGADSVEVARDSVPVGTYTRARVAFRRMEADVIEGLLVGGVPIRGRVSVAIGPEPIVVESPVLLRVQPNGEHTLVIDLNAEAWLLTLNPLTREVLGASFRSAVDLRVQ